MPPTIERRRGPRRARTRRAATRTRKRKRAPSATPARHARRTGCWNSDFAGAAAQGTARSTFRRDRRTRARAAHRHVERNDATRRAPPGSTDTLPRAARRVVVGARRGRRRACDRRRAPRMGSRWRFRRKAVVRHRWSLTIGADPRLSRQPPGVNVNKIMPCTRAKECPMCGGSCGCSDNRRSGPDPRQPEETTNVGPGSGYAPTATTLKKRKKKVGPAPAG